MRKLKRVYSSEQMALVTYAESGTGNAAGRARAGTGKSATGEEMMEQAPEASKAYVQFNKRNQLEMQARITAPRCEVVTFHSACNRFLTKNWGFMRAQSFWAEANRVNAIDSACKGFPLNQTVKLISNCKNEFPHLPTVEQVQKIALKYGIEDCTQQKYPLETIIDLAAKALPLALEKPANKQISFDDMIWVPVVNGWVSPIADFVIGDEFQDMNAVQHAAFLKLYGKRAAILGDDRQQIYGWRGAVHGGFDAMVASLKAPVFPITVSRRCARAIVGSVTQWVPDFQAYEHAEQGEFNPQVEFNGMVKQAKPGDAILSRLNAPSLAVCFTFLRAGIAARIEGRDIAAQLESIVKQVADTTNDIVEFLNKLETWRTVRISKAQGWNAQATIDFVCDQADTLKVLADNCNSVQDMFTKLNTLFEDSNGNERPCVKISTVHKAKGLEWSKVYILSDTFRGRANITDEQAKEEENVLYVARTRAKSSLNLVRGLNLKPE